MAWPGRWGEVVPGSLIAAVQASTPETPAIVSPAFTPTTATSRLPAVGVLPKFAVTEVWPLVEPADASCTSAAAASSRLAPTVTRTAAARNLTNQGNLVAVVFKIASFSN